MSRQLWEKIKSFWKGIVALSVILAIVVSLLKICEQFDCTELIATAIAYLHSILLLDIPVLYLILFGLLVFVGLMLIRFLRRRRRRRPTTILDFDYAIKLAVLCMTPRTTEHLRQEYNRWKSQSRIVVFPSYSFDDYMKQLEEQGFLTYSDINGKWRVARKALDYIEKYHGYLVRKEDTNRSTMA